MDFLYRFAVKVMDVNETLDLQQKVARLQALLEVSRRIHATIQLDEVLRVALEIVVRYGFKRFRAISIEPADLIAMAAQRFGQEDDITVLSVELQPLPTLI